MTKFLKRVKDRVYRFLPLPHYYGEEYRSAWKLLSVSSSWSREELAKYKLDRLRLLAIHAQKRVPYYRELFAQIGFKAEDIQTLEDFSRIPVLKQDTLRERAADLQAENIADFAPIASNTSGTTGASKFFYRTAKQEAFRHAAFWRELQRHGYNYRDLRISLDAPVSFDSQSPPFEHDRIENDIILNTHLAISQQAEKLLDIMYNSQPRMIWCMPSILAVVVDKARQKNRPPITTPLIAVTGEKIEPAVKELLRERCQAKFIEYYGNRENNIACWGAWDDIFTEESECCHLEIIPAEYEREREDGGDGRESGTVGDLIATSLHNYAMPLLRYQADDVVEWRGFETESASRPSLRLIGGRGRDLLLTKNGLTAPFVNAYIRREGFHKARKLQLEQTGLETLTVRVVPTDSFDPERDKPRLYRLLHDSLLGDFQVRVEYVDDIPLTPGGKYRAVISKLAQEYNQRSAKPSALDQND